MLRVVSAAVLIAVLVLAVYMLPPWATLGMAVIFAALGGGELAAMAARLDAEPPRGFVPLAAAAVTLAFVLDDHGFARASHSLPAVLLALVVIAGCTSLLAGAPSPQAFTRAAVAMMAPLYVGLPLGAVVWVHWTEGRLATSWLIAIIIVSDSAQFYTGRAFGRRKLAPTISPGKSIEGAVGGLVAAGLSGFFLAAVCLPAVAPFRAGLVAVLLSVCGMAGDLFESLLKRSAGVKDSSNLIPGHGGVLDRIDAYLFAAPVFYLFLRYIR